MPRYLQNARCFSCFTKFTIVSTAVGKGEMPSEQTWCPRKLNSVVPNWHFLGPIIIPYLARRLNKIVKYFLCVAWSGLVTSKSSRWKTKSRLRVTRSMNLWNVWPELRKPKGVLVKLKRPNGGVTAVLWTSESLTGIC